MKLPPLGPDEKVRLHSTFFEDSKRKDGQFGAVLLFDRKHGRRWVKDSIELVSADKGASDKAVSDFAERHAINLDDLVLAGEGEREE